LTKSTNQKRLPQIPLFTGLTGKIHSKSQSIFAAPNPSNGNTGFMTQPHKYQNTTTTSCTRETHNELLLDDDDEELDEDDELQHR
jgi:hypothetical protein